MNAPLNKTCLSDGDYTLSDGKAWIEVGPFAVRIEKTCEGIVVDVYPNGHEDEQSIVSCYAFDDEAEVDAPVCTKDALIQGEPCNCEACVQDCDCNACIGDDEN